MRRALGVPGAVLLLAGCEVGATVYNGDYALEFDGASCVRAKGDPVATGGSFTVEVWLRAPEDAANQSAALVTMGNVAMLWADAQATGLSQPSESPNTGWQTQRGLYDGELHHVAATWSADGGGNIFIDGLRSGTGQPWTVLPGLDAFAIGCWPDGNRGFEGIIDEVRISTLVRYPTNFNVPIGPFETDEATLALWHLDSGVGDFAADEKDRFGGTVEGAAWVGGLLAPDEADSGS